MYCAIIGDIIKSREIIDRLSVQIKLKNILSEVNRINRNDIVSKFTITIGDEFQGLLESPKNLMRILDYIKNEFHPLKLRFGIGYGILETYISEEIAIGSDGPAYHSARKAINEVKLASNKYEQPLQDIKIYYNDPKFYSSFNLINATLSTCFFMENRWSIKQREVVKMLMYDDKSQRELAKDLDLKQSSIQRRLNSAGYTTYKNAKYKLSEFLINIWGKINDK